MSRSTHHDPGPLAECLRAAQGEAERFYGDGPVRAWQPARPWRAAVVAAVLVGAAASAAVLLWPVNAVAPDQPVPAVVTTARPSVDTLVAHAAPADPPAAPLAALPAPALPTPAQAGVDPSLALPEDLNDWALDPQPTAAPAERQRPLHNVPPPPDESDATPAEESAPDEPAGGGLGE